MIKLSIVIPYYKTHDETKKLMDILIPQLTEETEVFLVDDGCHEERLDEYKDKINIIHLEENHGLSYARNIGIKKAQGKYLTFVDSDDYVSDDYVKSIIDKINSCDFDYCYFSWEMINIKSVIRILDNPPTWNLAVWNAVYKTDYLELFDENIRFMEDVPWQVEMRKKNGKKEIIDKVLYYYNDGRPGSLTSTGGKGVDNNAMEIKKPKSMGA